jgi:enoyl-CoA hydratase/carnithine racemase
MSASLSNHHAAVEIDEHGVATVTIREAKSLNILGTPVIADLTQAVRALAERDDVRVLVVRGTGDKGFIGGADINEMAALTRERAEVFISALRDLCNALRHFPVPVIARMPGWCLGGGLELALACDIRIAADNAQLGMPEVKVGIPSVIHAALMPRLIGNARAAWLLLTGEIADAAESLAAGLVSRVVPLADLDVEVVVWHHCWPTSARRWCVSRSGCCASGKKRRSTCRSTTAWRSSAAPLTLASRSITWPPS